MNKGVEQLRSEEKEKKLYAGYKALRRALKKARKLEARQLARKGSEQAYGVHRVNIGEEAATQCERIAQDHRIPWHAPEREKREKEPSSGEARRRVVRSKIARKAVKDLRERLEKVDRRVNGLARRRKMDERRREKARRRREFRMRRKAAKAQERPGSQSHASWDARRAQEERMRAAVRGEYQARNTKVRFE